LFLFITDAQAPINLLKKTIKDHFIRVLFIFSQRVHNVVVSPTRRKKLAITLLAFL
jgi:hypothetical protein